MSNLLRYVAIGSFALMIGAAPVQARAASAAATGGVPSQMDELSAKKGGGGGGGKHAGGGHRGGGGGKHAGGGHRGGGGKHAGRPGGGHHHGGGKHAGRPGGHHNAGRHNAGRHGRNVVVVKRPVRVWTNRPYYGRVVGGVALGTIIAAGVIGTAPVAPAPNMCWFWTDPSQSRGYWDYCVAP